MAADDSLKPLSQVLSAPGNSAESYAVSGSFVRWLIKTRGKELFRKLWAEYNELAAEGPDPRDPWAEVYGASLEVQEAAWRSSIR